MGNGESKAFSDDEVAHYIETYDGFKTQETPLASKLQENTQENEDSDTTSNSSNEEDSPPESQKFEILPNKPTKKSTNKKVNLIAIFKDYLYDDDQEEFDCTKFSGCYMKAMKKCHKILFEYFFQNFRTIIFCRDLLYKIFMNSRLRATSKKAYDAAFSKIFNRELRKISLQRNKWNDVVMFGAFLTRLLENHQTDVFDATTHMKIWILELIKYSANGNENALIAYMLILRRIKYTINPYRGSYIQFLEVLMILLKSGPSESKSKEVAEYLENCSKLDDHTPLHILKYRKESKKSNICKAIKNFLISDDDQTSFDLNLFTTMTSNEIEFFAKEFIEMCIQNPQKIKLLAAKAIKIQKTISICLKISNTIKLDLQDEIEKMMVNNGKSVIPILNLAKFIGEIGIHLGITPVKLLTDFMALLSDMGETEALTETLRLCGWRYKSKEPKKFQEFMKSIGEFASDVNDEIDKALQASGLEDLDLQAFLKYQESRMFCPADNARMISNLEIFLSEISKDKNVDYNYKSLYDSKSFYSIYDRQPFIRELSQKTANVIKLAQFLKSLFNTSSNIAAFVRRLKYNLNHKIAEMPVDRPHEMIIVGKLIGELKNLSVIDKLPQDKWLDMIKSLKPTKNVIIMEIQLDVLKVMMYNLYIQDEKKYMTFHQLIKAIDTSDPKYPKNIKSKVHQIFQNFIHKTLSKSSKSLLFRIKSGYRIDSLPYDIPDTSPTDFDLSDFVKLFFISATMNQYFMDNFLNSMKFLTRGSRGQIFDNLLYSLAMDRYKNMLNPDYFDEDDAIAILQFVLLFYPQNFFGQHSLTTFLENILAFEEFEAHKSCYKILLKMIKKDSMFKDFLRRKDQDSKVFKLLRKIQNKFINLQDSTADENEEVEIWHIVDYLGYEDDQDNPKSEPSQVVWSFTENYKENQEKLQKMLEDSKKSEQKVDVLAQKLKDYSQICQEPQNSRFDTRNAEKSQYSFSSRSAQNSEQSLQHSDQLPQKSAFKIQILPETSRYSAPETSYNRQYQNYDRRNQNTRIEWNITRDNLKDRTDLKTADSKIFRNRNDDDNSKGSVESGYSKREYNSYKK